MKTVSNHLFNDTYDANCVDSRQQGGLEQNHCVFCMLEKELSHMDVIWMS